MYMLNAIAISANPRVLVFVRMMPPRMYPTLLLIAIKTAEAIISGMIMARSNEYMIKGALPSGVSDISNH